jgi:UDPglucose 6-dehydrogenase
MIGMHGAPSALLSAVMEINQHQRWRFFRRVRESLGGLEGKRIGVWGLAFKPNTDDVRESVALDLIDRFLEEGAEVCAYDPAAMSHVEGREPRLMLAGSPITAAEGADALVLVTEWEDFRSIDPVRLREVMRGNLVFDGRNHLDGARFTAAGLRYHGIGRRV